MAMIKVTCPICGKETQANDERSFTFCTECGNRFELSQINSNDITNDDATLQTDKSSEELEKGLEEASFYYKLSYDKKEADHLDKRPEYYEKAQEKLLSLSQQFPSDYRVWWELSKPVDYNEPEKTKDVNRDFGISEKYFNKALDLCSLEVKKDLISKKDKYDTEKNKVVEEYQNKVKARLAEEEKKQQEILKLEEEAKKARELEQQRKKAEVQQKRAENRKEAKQFLVPSILTVLAWLTFITGIFPYIFGIISLCLIRKTETEKFKGLKKGIFIADIAVLVSITLILILGILIS